MTDFVLVPLASYRNVLTTEFQYQLWDQKYLIDWPLWYKAQGTQFRDIVGEFIVVKYLIVYRFLRISRNYIKFNDSRCTFYAFDRWKKSRENMFSIAHNLFINSRFRAWHFRPMLEPKISHQELDVIHIIKTISRELWHH